MSSGMEKWEEERMLLEVFCTCEGGYYRVERVAGGVCKS